jgi:hypothetical protein
MITSQNRSIRRIARVTTGLTPHEPSGAKELAMIRHSAFSRTSFGVRRRGVVLVVVLAMLGLLAVIGVSFATYSNQAQIASRRFIANTKANVDPDSLLSYAMEQLINDSNNRLSSLRGHSLKRDMYGNDSVFHGIVTTVPLITATNFPKPQVPPTITAVPTTVTTDPVSGVALSRPAMLVQTNIPVTGTPFDGYDFSRWVMKVAVCTGFDADGRPLNQNPNFLTQTVEVLNGAWATQLQSGGYRRLLIAQPDTSAGLAQVNQNVRFSLDGRFLRSFNGSGVSFTDISGISHDWGLYPNMRLNAASSITDTVTGLFRPSGLPSNPDLTVAPGLDEDYDAADLENWFLALQSADASITLPSFHRPGILRYDMSTFNASAPATWGNYLMSNDWRVGLPASGAPTAAQMATYASSAAKFLRPRAVDGHDRNAFPDLVPDMRPTNVATGAPNPTLGQIGWFESDPTTGVPNGASPDDWVFHPGYDVDNDGDGYNDSVWLDLGFPVQTDANGKKYKPLFAFLIVGLNGRLPMNTAGNLHDRDFGVRLANKNFDTPTAVPGAAGEAVFNHTSHLGTSPTEVNPKFAFRNVVNPAADAANRETLSTLGLRGILAGARDGSTALPGRWGDSRYLQAYLGTIPPATDPRDTPFGNPVRPGKSMPFLTGGAALPPGVTPDASDDDSDVHDFLPDVGSAGGAAFYSPERGDGTYPSTSRNLLLSVERQRRFVTPIDPVGTGRIIAWNRQPLYYPGIITNYFPNVLTLTDPAHITLLSNQMGAPAWYGRGADNRGRVGYFGYYRPPGVSVPEIPPPTSGSTVNLSTTLLNPLHGFESYRNPLMIVDTDSTFQGGGFNAAMPYNFGDQWATTMPPTLVPYPFSDMVTLADNKTPANYPAANIRGTFTRDIATDQTTINGFMPAAATPAGLLTRDEADEQNLYDPNDQFDEPFRASDLADLYLKGSTYDASSDPVRSRVANLFTTAEAMHVAAKPNPTYQNTAESPEVQNFKRWPVSPRKLFSNGVWDTNRFSWSPDNPGNAFRGAAVAGWNSNFEANQSASAPNLSFNVYGNFVQFPTPSLALGDRRINLNFPLPAYDYQAAPSTARYIEPTRQKWLCETYQLMLRVLPPKAVDTPLEKAQLAQFLVNVVDYRDPDGVMTLFTAENPITGDLGHGLYQTVATATDPSVIVESLTGPPMGTKPLDLWGMEYNPVALNEVLAYEFEYWGAAGTGTATQHRRIFIELVNTLTASATNAGAFAAADPSDQNMLGWDFVVAEDANATGVPDATGRPDPFTGQLPTAAGVIDDPLQVPMGKIGSRTSTSVPVSGTAGSPLPAGSEVKAMRRLTPTDNDMTVIHTVIGNSPAATPGVEINGPDTYLIAAPYSGRVVYHHPTTATSVYDDLLPAIGDVTKTEEGRYFWLYLRRPADPADPTSPMVVVDSIRFPYMVTDAVQTSPTTPTITESNTRVYSVQRMQPYRGAHAVRNNTTTPYFPYDAYGYSEQGVVTEDTAAADSNTHTIGYTTAGATIVSDERIRHTIGDPTSHSDREAWENFAFADRDYQSVAELLLVPSIGPGRFTKMFVENQPQLGLGRRDPTPRIKPDDNPPNYAMTPPYSANYGTELRDEPSVYPYLSDRFFYTAAKQEGYVTPLATVTGSGPVPAILTPGGSGDMFGSPSADGWHRMLEFFEVPSNMNGAIGPVTEGENGDWSRQFRVPGKLNLNLITDEEVFMGLLDEARVNLAEIDTTVDVPPHIATGQFVDTAGVVQPMYMNMPNRGYPVDPTGRNLLVVSPFPMKRAFSDFLKLRHGGSGTLLTFGQEPTGTPTARERPFRSLSFPDINYTILRPGALPPSTFTHPALPTATSLYTHNYVIGADPNFLELSTVRLPMYLGDPGVRNIFLDYSPQFAYAQPPALPIRRLFQIPDAHIGYDAGARDWDRNSNASLFGNPVVNQTIAHYNLSTSGNQFFTDFLAAGVYNPASVDVLDLQTPAKAVWPPASLFVPTNVATALNTDLSAIPNPANPTAGPVPPVPLTATTLQRPLLGANVYQRPVTVDVAGTPSHRLDRVEDRRQHPMFRTELLQKIMNLTTVRTHQFAVYVTVGFFEVKKEGSANTLQPDILGPEIDKNSRYTMFAVVDRTRAEGFNPLNPGNYRDLVEYERRLK